jgi:hypothetical protein
LKDGAAEALERYTSDLASGTISESTVNTTGYALMSSDKISDAILVFRKNVELHSDSWNAYDSLGEAYANNGDKELAVKNYKKSVELNPGSVGGKAALKKLGAE